MERRELEEVVELTINRAVPQAVRHTLEHYGVDVQKPGEVQRDLAWLRSARRFTGSVLTKVLTTLALALLLVGAAAWAITAKLPHLGG